MLFLLYAIGPMAHGSGRAWASNMRIVLRAWTYFLQAGLGPSLIIQFACRVCTTAAGPGRAWASNHICGPGLCLNCRALVYTLQIMQCQRRTGRGGQCRGRPCVRLSGDILWPICNLLLVLLSWALVESRPFQRVLDLGQFSDFRNSENWMGTDSTQKLLLSRIITQLTLV